MLFVNLFKLNKFHFMFILLFPFFAVCSVCFWFVESTFYGSASAAQAENSYFMPSVPGIIIDRHSSSACSALVVLYVYFKGYTDHRKIVH